MNQYRIYRCEWEMGDVFAYRMESELARGMGMHGRHLLFQKVGETAWHPGHVIPVAWAKLTAGEGLPSSAEEFDPLEYVQIAVRRTE